jgi:hypothetical protein
MDGSAILIEEPIKGVMKEVSVATTNADLLLTALFMANSSIAT